MSTTKFTIWMLTITAIAMVLMAPLTAQADPLPGQVLKFDQQPMNGTPIAGVKYYGHDELSTLYQLPTNPGTQPLEFTGIAMADDFADRFNTPVVHVRWWGSYLDNFINDNQPVNKFLIAFESDKPADAANFSRPDQVLLSQIVTRAPIIVGPGSGTYTEKKLVTPAGVEEIYEYNAELSLDFPQKPDTVYWLKIAALVEGSNGGGQTPSDTRWGWHSRDYTINNPLASVAPAVIPGEVDQQPTIDPNYPSEVWHFQDDAVSADTRLVIDPTINTLDVIQTNYEPQNYLDGLDGPGVNNPNGTHGGIGRFSKDLAFQLYTIPEPASLALMGIGALMMLRRRRPQ